MKVLVLYATKHGATAEIAEKIAKKMDGVAHNLANKNLPNLADFEYVILGSSVYASTIRKEMKQFLAKMPQIQPIAGIFLSSFEEKDDFFAKNFPPHVLAQVKVKAFLGGIFDPTKVGGIERAIIKAVMKQTKYTSTITDEKITQFINSITS